MKKTSKFLALVLSFLTTASSIGLAGAVKPEPSPEASTGSSSEEIKKNERKIREELKNISDISMYRPYNFTFGISHEPITQNETNNALSELQDEVNYMENYFFSEDKNIFGSELFKVLVLIYNLKDLYYHEDLDLSRYFVTMFLSIVNPEMSETIEANSVRVLFYQKRLTMAFFLNGVSVCEFTATVN